MHPSPDDVVRNAWQAYADDLLAFATSRLPGGGPAPDDLTQEVFAAFAQTLATQTVANPRAWLYRSLRNRITDAYRRAASRPIVTPLDESPGAYSARGDDAPPDYREFGGAYGDDEFWSEVDNALATLPPAQREVFERNVLDGETLQSIADSLDVPLRTAISRKRYARQRLQTLLADAYANFFGDQ